MPNYKRYKVCSSWLLDNDELSHEDVLIVIEVADLKDKRTGHVYRDGAWRVRFVRIVLGQHVKPPAKTKVYFGEAAHLDAIRYANDAFYALQHGREVPAK